MQLIILAVAVSSRVRSGEQESLLDPPAIRTKNSYNTANLEDVPEQNSLREGVLTHTVDAAGSSELVVAAGEGIEATDAPAAEVPAPPAPKDAAAEKGLFPRLAEFFVADGKEPVPAAAVAEEPQEAVLAADEESVVETVSESALPAAETVVQNPKQINLQEVEDALKTALETVPVAAYVLHDPGTAHAPEDPCAAIFLDRDQCEAITVDLGISATACETITVHYNGAGLSIRDALGAVGGPGDRWTCADDVLLDLKAQLERREKAATALGSHATLRNGAPVPAFLVHDDRHRASRCDKLVLAESECVASLACTPIAVELRPALEPFPFLLTDATGAPVGRPGDRWVCRREVFEQFLTVLVDTVPEPAPADAKHPHGGAEVYLQAAETMLDSAEQEIHGANSLLDVVDAVDAAHGRPTSQARPASKVSV